MKNNTPIIGPLGAVVSLLDQSISFREKLATDRTDAIAYYNGEMRDLPATEGWSQVVSMDVQATINKVMPSLSRTILGDDMLAEFGAMQEEDQEGAEQATEYINLYVVPKERIKVEIESSLMDACKIRNGVLHVCAYEKKTVTGSKHTKLNAEGASAIMQDEGVQVLTAKEEGINEKGEPLIDLEIRRVVTEVNPKIVSIPMEEYLIHPDGMNSHEDAPLVGRETLMTRSDLVSMWADDKKMVERISDLSAASSETTMESERLQRRKNAEDTVPEVHELQPIQVFDLYVRVDFDEDGIAELRHIMFCGGKGEENVFINEYADFVPYYDVVIERNPHQWEGKSITDHVASIQRVKTSLLRSMQDNLYLVNDPQPVINADHLKNPDAVTNRVPGKPIYVFGTDNVNNAITYHLTPYIGDKAMEAIAYWDREIQARTGIDDAAGGLPPDALQNVTAKASAIFEAKSLAKAEQMARTVADCLKPVFAGLLRLICQHQNKPQMVRLRNKYVEIDPRSWNSDMDVSINTGLGAGSRERDMMVMQNILTLQQGLVSMFGPDNPFVKPDNVYNGLEKSVRAAGINAVGQFFTKPDPEEVAARMKAAAEQKPLEIQVVEAKAMADLKKREMELPVEMQMKQLDVQAAREKEIVQSQAAVEERKAVSAIESEAKREELALKKYEIDTKKEIELMKLAQSAKDAEADRENDVKKTQAQSFGKEALAREDEANKPAKDAGPKLVELIEKMNKRPKKAKFSDGEEVELVYE